MKNLIKFCSRNSSLVNLPRNVFTKPPEKFFEYNDKVLVGFRREEMFDVVADVQNLPKFLPYCLKSTIYDRRKNFFKADVKIGQSPITISYTSHVSLNKPHQITVESFNPNFLEYLRTKWQFSAGLKDIPDSCVVDFSIAFQIKMGIYSKFTHAIFDILVRQMRDAFFKEAVRRYGPPSIDTVNLKILKEQKFQPILKDQGN